MIRTRVIAAPVWSAATLPAAIWAATGWQLGLCEPAHWDRAPLPTVLEMLSDLATYGLIAGACSIGEDTLAWPEDGPAHGSGGHGGYPRLTATEPANFATDFPPDAFRAEFVATPADASSEVPGYALLAGARAAAAQLRLPFVNTALLTLIGSAQVQGIGTPAPRNGTPPMPDIVVPFPQIDATAFVMQLKPAIRRALTVQRKVLRERRRLILGLPVGVAEEVLNEQIEAHLVLPLARRYIGGCIGEAGARIHLVASGTAGALAALAPQRIAVSHFDAGEPTGENIFALTLRRLFYQNPRSASRRFFDISPLALRRRVGRRSPCATGVGHAMLAALQMQFLESNLAARG
ncbi:hypothetical protein ACT2FY_00740 [Paraburkholderia fungorum]|uniref:hypothetical protein n=1 Tax=Paraburkholderia fungorum TaxID=134537 RepID=UPI00402BB922